MKRRSYTLGRDDVPALTDNCVHVWSVPTGGSLKLETFTEVLSSEEKARADRFHFERDRRAFIVCRGALRRLISTYTGISAAHIGFRVGPHGKPSLKQEHRTELRFNVSHSGEVALVAFSLHEELGVDVELKRTNVDFLALAQLSFSRDERAAILSCSAEDRADLFYEFWTCKEAYIKADGRGLSVPLDQFSVATRGVDPRWREIISVGHGPLARGMRGRMLAVGENYAAAAVTNLPAWQVMQMDMEFA
ncbi:MAG TPA: 4'-phosphopantetheinyl transferase superfamily protein [Candidatus Acidoferrales bacterium]|jgi:4'-phosphopantetheinyl transferase|nr:4'-phosphopantetheinyl transferase superfamily protein [Candidatus Acidoferrales bacterium]